MLKTGNCACGGRSSGDAFVPSEKLTSDATLGEMAQTFKCLADPSRLKIINALLLAEMCVHSLAQSAGMSQPAVSHHLKQLRQMRLVKWRREGKAIFYSLNDLHIQQLFDLSRIHIGESEKHSGR